MEYDQASQERSLVPNLAHNVFKSNLVDPLLSHKLKKIDVTKGDFDNRSNCSNN
jgi:hypothetical protein